MTAARDKKAHRHSRLLPLALAAEVLIVIVPITINMSGVIWYHNCRPGGVSPEYLEKETRIRPHHCLSFKIITKMTGKWFLNCVLVCHVLQLYISERFLARCAAPRLPTQVQVTPRQCLFRSFANVMARGQRRSFSVSIMNREMTAFQGRRTVS